MVRPLLVLVAGCLAGTAVAAPNLKERPANLLFPTELGTTWVYTEGESERTEVITAVEQKGDTTVITVADEFKERRQQALRSYRKFGVRANEVVVLETNLRRVEQPWYILRLTDKEDDRRWAVCRSFNAGSGERLTWEVGEPAEIDVPAGRFKAVPVKFELWHYDKGKGDSMGPQ